MREPKPQPKRPDPEADALLNLHTTMIRNHLEQIQEIISEAKVKPQPGDAPRR